jgi:hypothetical protein
MKVMHVMFRTRLSFGRNCSHWTKIGAFGRDWSTPSHRQAPEPFKYVTITNVLSLPTADANCLLQSLNQFQDSLDDGDEDLPSDLLIALAELHMKLEAIKV